MQVIKLHDDYSILITTQCYKMNEVVRKLSGPISSYPTRTSIQIGDQQHVEDCYGAYSNHSFTPTTKIHNGCIIAIVDMNIGDEITFNYNDTEKSLSCPFIDTATNIYVKGYQK